MSGAWPFLVRGVICLLYCDNERDQYLLNSGYDIQWGTCGAYGRLCFGRVRQSASCLFHW